ncbi:hypothetical protein MAR_021049 [Mya arenaria]|uniref:DUF6589 domain-containing protein n=1 Tax=Mya arenaria TaxID=6604 RepID=A0ABY7E9M5_MYAAR|nr:hypothetical protein MAR_021049 [Mya arenaria]
MCDLIDKSENDSEVTDFKKPSIVEKVVLGGDVLTNERAYSAQQAMANGNTDFECLGGFIHRPEGFHRLMNFVQVIYQMFYQQSADRGTLWCLRIVVNQRDVSGPKEVVQNYRHHDSLFLFMALLLKSASEAYKYHGDGARAVRNLKFEGVFAGAIGHTKYRLCLWRTLAYVKCVLSPRKAYEYMWNISCNIVGGLGNNIPNDNLVELMVKTIKKKFKTQGANVRTDCL